MRRPEVDNKMYTFKTLWKSSCDFPLSHLAPQKKKLTCLKNITILHISTAIRTERCVVAPIRRFKNHILLELEQVRGSNTLAQNHARDLGTRLFLRHRASPRRPSPLTATPFLFYFSWTILCLFVVILLANLLPPSLSAVSHYLYLSSILLFRLERDVMTFPITSIMRQYII